MKKTAVVNVDKQPDETSIDVLLAKAVEKQVPVETMEKLLGMRRELRAEFAKSEFAKAMSNFQSECPIIEKKKKAYGYYYAPLEAIVGQVKSLLEKNGFSYSIQTAVGDKTAKVICSAKHIAGHTEQSEVEFPIVVKTQMMTNIQAVASTLTYAKRYAFCNAFGILTGDEDNDAQETNPEEELKKQVEKALEKLNGVANLNALKGVFIALPAEVKKNPEVVKLTQELKVKFTLDENNKVRNEGGVASSEEGKD